MRILKAIANDIKFQFRYGFYLLYLIITIIYVAILYFLPNQYREIGAVIVVFSDPSALGLVFMGAIVLFEKSQRVLNSIFISPLTIDEYILAKVVSLSIISTLAGFCIVLPTTRGDVWVIPLFLGLVLGSILFSLTGLMIASRVTSLNQFMVGLILPSTLLSTPPFLAFLDLQHPLLSLHPGIGIIKLIIGGVEKGEIELLSILIPLLWIGMFWILAKKNIRRMVHSLGGIKL